MEDDRSPWGKPEKPSSLSEDIMETQGPMRLMPPRGGRTTRRDVICAVLVVLLGAVAVFLEYREEEARYADVPAGGTSEAAAGP